MKGKLTVLALVMAITPQMRATIHRAFRPDDFEIVWTETPSEAVKVSTARHPGLVVLDLGPSRHAENGILENLRTLNPTAPMVVLAEDPATHDAAIADARVAVLRKPIVAAALADTASALLQPSPRLSGPPASEGLDPSMPAHNAERFREALDARYHAPFEYAPSYRHWGINE